MPPADALPERRVVRFRHAVLLAPLLMFLHQVEEYPDLIAWLNAYLADDFSRARFFAVNGFGLAMTVGCSLYAALLPDRVSAFVALCWVSFALFWNGVFHLAANVLLAADAPGAVTSALLYLPYGCLLAALAYRDRLVRARSLALAVLLGGAAMGTQAYLLFFEGRSLW